MTTASMRESSPRAAPAALPSGGFDWLLAAAALAMAAAIIRAMLFTPMEAQQGLAQKIYYVHVPAILSAYLAFSIVAVTSIVYLWLKDERADHLAESAAEVGLVFTTVTLTTGPIWARPIWGAWWSWDVRLTSTLFLWFIYAAFLVLRDAITDRAMRARYSAVLGVLGALLIPFIHMSVYLFRTLHPMPIVIKPDRPSLSGEMLTTFLVAYGAFTLLCIALLRARYRYAVERDALAELEEGAA